MQNAIQKIQDQFKNPQAGFPFGVVVVGMMPGEDPMVLRGKLMRLSPEESLDGLILKVASRITVNAEDSELQEWLALMKSITCTFELHGAPHQLYW